MFLIEQENSLTDAVDFIGPDAAGANRQALVLAVGHDNAALLQVRVLEETVVLVRKTDFVRFVAALIAHFANACHGRKSFNHA